MTRSVLGRLAGAGALVLVAGCAARPVAVAVVPPPVSLPAPVAASMPAGGVPGMTIPARLADGRYPTPTRDAAGRPLSTDAAVWHLRAALNVAALVCRGGGDPVATAYNAMLTGRRTALAGAEQRFALEWKAGGTADWRDGYDNAMTRLYNFYGQSFARAGFCTAAGTTLAELAGVPDAELPALAPRYLARLDAPFTDFFAAYDAWRGRTVAPPPLPHTLIALVAVDTAPIPPHLEVDPAIYRLP